MLCSGRALVTLCVLLFQIEDIIGKYGLVVISRAGSDPEKFIYESDQLFPFKVCISGCTVDAGI